MADFSRDSMLEMFTFEMGQLVEQLEQQILDAEDELSDAAVNEIFRIMHTIKGSAAMMLYNNIADTTHKIEDMFFYIRENNPKGMDNQKLTDIVLEAIDFVKEELAKIEAGEQSDGTGDQIVVDVKEFMDDLKSGGKGREESGEKREEKKAFPVTEISKPKEAPLSSESKEKEEKEEKERDFLLSPLSSLLSVNDAVVYNITLWFEAGCEMENVRAYTVIRNLEPITLDIDYVPRNIDRDESAEESAEAIKKNGFKIKLISYASIEEVNDILEQTTYMEDYKVEREEASKKEENKGMKPDAVKDTKREKEEVKAGGKEMSNEMPEPTGSAKNYFKITVKFEEGCEMENIRSYTVLRNLEQAAVALSYNPTDILENEASAEVIRRQGFKINLKTNENYETIRRILEETVFLKEMTIEDAEAGETKTLVQKPKEEAKKPEGKADAAAKGPDAKRPMGGTMISVNINKLDALLNLTGELVTSEAMVTQNPDLAGLELENFQKAVRQLRKIINDIQDTVMSMRMVPLSPTFAKMHRIVRDMCKSLDKEVALELVGEDTEVDKNIIEHISDPLMHIIRNSIDHGIEKSEKRREKGKSDGGKLILEAGNAGGDVIITVKDDGAGIDKERVMAKAKANGLLRKPESEYSDKEIYNFIFAPGFSTNDEVTSYSGRGVGMDVVTTNIEKVGGSVIVDSEPGSGTTTTLKIPLTLAIINGMIVEINKAKYTIPINTIKESFKASEKDILTDPDGNEMIMVRGECYNVMRLHEFFGLDCERLAVDDGIMIMLENDEKTIVVLANELIGEQQVVVKAIPSYIKKVRGLSGCTLLGNGDISLIVDSAGFFNS